MAEAIFDGHRLARELESPDPLVALPYLRERPGDPPRARRQSRRGRAGLAAGRSRPPRQVELVRGLAA